MFNEKDVLLVKLVDAIGLESVINAYSETNDVDIVDNNTNAISDYLDGYDDGYPISPLSIFEMLKRVEKQYDFINSDYVVFDFINTKCYPLLAKTLFNRMSDDLESILWYAKNKGNYSTEQHQLVNTIDYEYQSEFGYYDMDNNLNDDELETMIEIKE